MTYKINFICGEIDCQDQVFLDFSLEYFIVTTEDFILMFFGQMCKVERIPTKRKWKVYL